jgi:hypothetical protein
MKRTKKRQLKALASVSSLANKKASDAAKSARLKRALAVKTANKHARFLMEARVGIEPTNEGFADLSLPTWVPRLGRTV